MAYDREKSNEMWMDRRHHMGEVQGLRLAVDALGDKPEHREAKKILRSKIADHKTKMPPKPDQSPA